MHHSRGTGGRRLAGLAALSAAGLLALAACSSSADSGGADAAVADSEARLVEEAEPAEQRNAEDRDAEQGPAQQDGQGAAADEAAPIAAPAHLIRTATVVVSTGDVAAGYAAAVERAVELGGYVSGEDTEREASGEEISRVTLKVPGDRYQELLTAVSELGELEHRAVSTEDVTDQVVDVESRIATQRESVARIRELLDRASSIGDIVDIEAELSTRQADLEALQSQYESLRDRTGMATVELELREPESVPEPAAREDDGDPSVAGAVSGGWDAFTTALLWVAVVLGAALPFLALPVLFLLGWRLTRGRFPRLPRPARVPGPGGADGTAP